MPNTSTYYTYVAKLDGIPKYVGAGKGIRYLHVNSGVSSNRELNRVVLAECQIFDIDIIPANSKQEAFETEQQLIAQYGLTCDGTGTLFNETLGGIGFRSKHTEASKRKIQETAKRWWSHLKSSPAYEKHRNKLKATPNSGRFVSGRKGTYFGGTPKKWVLVNNNTDPKITYEFVDREKFWKDNPSFEPIVRWMHPNRIYKSGRRVGWYLTQGDIQ